MNRDPIEELLHEHQVIMAQIADLRAAVQELARHGEEALPANLPVFARIGRMMATQLDLHRRKEDDVLFPALEAVLGHEETPIGVMRQEHQDIHGQGVLLRQTLHELNEVQHPAIEAGAARMRDLVAGDASDAATTAEALRATGEEIIQLLDMHFAKEEEILFPMARQLLEPEALAAISDGYRRLSPGE
jgi:regulator of cell morphogenesis and NO signaling